MDVGNKSALKGKPKIFVADAAIRNAVLMIDDVLSDESELGVMVETTVFGEDKSSLLDFIQVSGSRNMQVETFEKNGYTVAK